MRYFFRTPERFGVLTLIIIWVFCLAFPDKVLEPWRAQDTGAPSPPGRICGLLNRDLLSDLTGLADARIHAEADAIGWPSRDRAEPRDYISLCNIERNEDPLDSVLGILTGLARVDSDSMDWFEQEIREEDDEGPLVEFSEPRGQGGYRAGYSAYFFRACPTRPTVYFISISGYEPQAFGKAAQWKALLMDAVDRADHDGWCDNFDANLIR